jgi:hypothetical protein
MDPESVVPPNLDSTNPDRSYEIYMIYDGVTYPVYPGGIKADALEGGRMIEIPGSNASTFNFGRVYFHIFKNGFRNLKGEPLDRDYLFQIFPCQSCLEPLVRAALPTSAQAEPDPSRPISLYFNQGVDPATFQAELLAPDGSVVGPLVYNWDTPFYYSDDPPNKPRGYFHINIEHPPLAPSLRPYRFRILKLWGPNSSRNWQPNANLPQDGMTFTIGPALAGDLNDDGAVTVADALLTLQGVLQPETLSDAQRFAADVAPLQGTNGRSVGDGAITIADAVLVLRRAAGLLPDAQWP